jgi:uncharacterized RDD family membrane protein YckC
MKSFPLHVFVDGATLGPLDRRQLALHLAAGGVKATDQACWAGFDAWMPLAEMVDVAELKAEGLSALKATPRIATKGRRLLARLLDVLVFWVGLGLALPVGLFLTLLVVTGVGQVEMDSRVGSITIVVLSVILCLGYHAAQTWGLCRYGQTLGKRWMGIKVVGSDGKTPGLRRVLLRRYLPTLMFFAPVFNLIWFVVSAGLFLFGTRRALHDRVADTCVVGA